MPDDLASKGLLLCLRLQSVLSVSSVVEVVFPDRGVLAVARKSSAWSPPRPQVLSLLEQAKDTPDDDAPRLVLADWLEEYGDEHDRARAELIRTQCRRARLISYTPAADELDERIVKLWRGQKKHWLG